MTSVTSGASMAQEETTADGRVDWVDYAKGWCIVLVVMMHSTLGVGDAFGRESWLHDFVAWARPFRMPDFFLVAGLFLSCSIDAPWRSFLDRKVLHFGYFYVLWTLIQGVPKLMISAGGDPSGVASGLAFALVEPFGTLWFIYLLPILFVVTKLLRRAPVDVVLIAAAIAQMAQVHTGSTVIDEFAGRYVYFFAGYAFSTQLFALAQWARDHIRASLGALLVWGVGNALAVRYGVAALPGVSLILGFAGAAAVVAFSALLAQARVLSFLRGLGSQSIVIYLAFFLPMAATRIILVKFQLIEDVGVASLLVTAIAILAPLALHSLVRKTRLRFLFERPATFRLADRPASAGTPNDFGARLRSA
jgi:uncharacterized membrane protein YcfT